MRGSDYVVKRIAYAILTVFIAVTLNFVLFRALSGDAVSALRCKQCSKAFKEEQRRDLGLDQSKWVQYRLYLASLVRGDLGKSVPSEKPVSGELVEPIKNSLPMIALTPIGLAGPEGSWIVAIPQPTDIMVNAVIAQMKKAGDKTVAFIQGLKADRNR